LLSLLSASNTKCYIGFGAALGISCAIGAAVGAAVTGIFSDVIYMGYKAISSSKKKESNKKTIIFN